MGRYARIKTQTNVAISWLIETAKSHGNNVRVNDDIDVPSPATATLVTTSTMTGRLEGKARKQAKNTQQQQDQDSTPNIRSPQKAYKVSTEEILRQARYLQGLGQEVVISKPAWNAFKQAVRGREEYANKFAHEEPEHEGNAGHVYFVDVLRRVVDIIGKVVRVQATSLDSSTKEQDESLTLHNMFETLQDIEIADDPQEAADVDASLGEGTAHDAAAAVPPARYKPTIDPREEMRFRWFCFQDDAESVISWVTKTWEEYFCQSEGRASLETTSLLSDLALELLYKLEDDMKDAVDSVREVMYSDPESVRDWVSSMLPLSGVREATREAAGYPVLVKLLHKRHPDLEIDGWDVSVVADRNLVRYLTELKQEMILRSNGWEENGPPFKHDRCISKTSLDAVSRSLADVTHGGFHGTSDLIAANLLRGIWRLRSLNAHEPFYRAAELANDMFVQFQQYLPDRIAFPAHRTEKVERYLRFRAIGSDQSAATLSGFHRDVWKHFDNEIEKKEGNLQACVSRPDPAATAKARLQHSDEYVMPPEDSHFLRKANPLTPAKLALNLQFLRTGIGFDFGNSDPSLAVMCHLYNALRQLGYLDVPWKSIDSLIEMHIKTLFLGALPTSGGKEMFNRLCIVFGCAPELIRARNTKNKNGREKNLTHLMGIQKREMDAFCFPPIMGIVSDHLHDREPLRRTLTRLDAEMVAKHYKASGSSRVKSFVDEENPTAFLNHLRTHFAEFQQYFETDCIELTRVCGGLLERLRTDEMSFSTKHLDTGAAHCVGLLILAELGTVDEKTRPGMSVPKTKFAREAAALLKEYIVGGGGCSSSGGKLCAAW